MRGGNHMDNQLPELKVNMLGRFSITYGEQPITFKRNSATKAVKLLQILLHSSLVEDRGSTGIPRAQLLDDLFGREELANVGNNLRVTVFRLRKMLIEAGLPEYEYIVKEKGVFYWRSPMKVDLDVARFMELVREGEEEVDENRKMNLWEKACRLYKGELLPMQSGEDWVIMNSVRYKDKIFQDTPPAVCLQKRTARIRHHSGTDRQCHRDLSVRRMAVLKNRCPDGYEPLQRSISAV